MAQPPVRNLKENPVKKSMMKKPSAKAEASIEKAENRLAKKLPPAAKKEFSKVQAKEKKLEGRE